jgi:hypothetical protein
MGDGYGGGRKGLLFDCLAQDRECFGEGLVLMVQGWDRSWGGVQVEALSGEILRLCAL